MAMARDTSIDIAIDIAIAIEMNIQIEDPVRADIQDLLREHLRDMRALSLPQSVRALDLDALRTPITPTIRSACT